MSFRVLSLAIVGGLLALILSGCACVPKTSGSGMEEATLIGTHKRYPQYMARNFTTRFIRQAYKQPPGNIWNKATGDQIAVLETFGEPDAVRRPFKSRRGEKVGEWVYLDEDLLFQFICGNVVHEGEVTDLEEILMVHGYPDVYRRAQFAPDIEHHLFSYRDFFTLQVTAFAFFDNELHVSQYSD